MCKLARVCLFVVACLLSLAAKAQVAVISGQTIDQNGQPLPNVQVRVCSVTSTGVPCSPTAAIYQDYGLTIPAPNPTTTDAYGNYTIYAGTLPAPNLYTVQYSPASGITWAYVFNGPFLSASGGTVTGFINALGYNGVPEADQCSGVDAWAKINTCAGMLPTGGVIDARGFGATTQTVTTPLTALSLPSRPITLLLNPATVFISNVVFSAGSIAAKTACMIPMAQGAKIETQGINEELNIRLGPSAATYDVVCNATQDGTQQSFWIDGLGIWGNPSATMAGSLIHVKNTFIGTEIDRVLTYQPYGNVLTDEGGSDHMYINDNFNDSATTGNYVGTVATLTCATNATFFGGSIEDNGPHNPLLIVQGSTSGGPSGCPTGNPAIGNHFVNVDFEIYPATVGSFSGAATNVDPVQCTDCSDFLIDKMVLYGNKGSGQQHIVDFLSSGANGQPRGPVEVDNLEAVNAGWNGLPLITNNATGFVSPVQASVIGTQNGCCSYWIGKYRWEGNGTNQASSIDYEDYKNFSSMVSQITNSAYSPIASNLQTAATAAIAGNGSILIPSNYTGTDTLISGGVSLNTSNFRVNDQRALNPTNAIDYLGGPMPSTTIKASEYGAVCNGTADDWPGIQAAANALVRVVGVLQIPPQPMDPPTVELPQGRCTISQPIVLTNYSSLKGAGGNGTWLSPGATWTTTGAMVQVTQSYAGSGYLNQGTTTINRSIKDINFVYNTNIYSITGIQVLNPTGHTSAQPYPLGAGPNIGQYQLPGVTIEGNVFYAMDTAVEFDDCGECSFINNQIFFVRLGIFDNGNNYGLTVSGNGVQAGTWSYSAPAQRTGATNGILSASAVRWICTGSSPCNATQTQVVSPQGLGVNNNDFSTWDTDAAFVNAQGLDVYENGFDYGGEGPDSAVANPTIYIGPSVYIAGLRGNYIAQNQVGGSALEIGAPASPGVLPGIGSFNDLDIQNNYILNYATGPATPGIVFDTGTFGRRGVKLLNNTFFNWGYAMTLGHPVQYSIIQGNFATLLSGTGALINLNATGSTSFLNTIISENTTPGSIVPIFDQAGGGYFTGLNVTGDGVVGSQTASAAGCTITPGAVGNTCGSTVTVTWPQQFIDAGYKVSGCTVAGGGGLNTVTVVTIGSGAITVSEVALTTTATGGGTISCTGTHG